MLGRNMRKMRDGRRLRIVSHGPRSRGFTRRLAATGCENSWTGRGANPDLARGAPVDLVRHREAQRQPCYHRLIAADYWVSALIGRSGGRAVDLRRESA